MGKVPDMEVKNLEQANLLFAKATAMLEVAIEIAVAEQSPRLTSLKLASYGRRLQALAGNIAVIAEAATIIARPSADEGRKRPKRRP